MRKGDVGRYQVYVYTRGASLILRIHLDRTRVMVISSDGPGAVDGFH